MAHTPRVASVRTSGRCPQATGSGHAHPALALRPLLAGLLLGLSLGAPTLAIAQLPVGPRVAHGTAAIATAGNRMTVTNSPSAIINWQGFSIGANHGVHFAQPSAASQVLNRVTGRDPSHILGSLSSNGGVWLINPHGVLFGRNARVDVAGLVASTLDIANADFLAGRYRFAGAEGLAGAQVLNQGELRTSFGGRLWLLGGEVQNEGLLDAPGGGLVLAAGQSVELVDSGAPNVIVRLSAPEDRVANLGTLTANGGRIDLHASIVNQDGLVQADRLGTDAAGQVVLQAATDLTLGATSETRAAGGRVRLGAETLNHRGTLRAQNLTLSATDLLQQGSLLAPGGTVTLRADNTTYLDGPVDVSNPAGTAGRIQLTTGTLEGMAGASLLANGLEGGRISIAGRGSVGFSSTLSATGTARGGLVEVTGNSLYLLNATVDASGDTAGGTVHLGGGWQGSGSLPHAREVLVGVGSKVKANSAGAAGTGGEVVVWSTEASEHYGALQALGGGRIEFSSQGVLRQTGTFEAGPGGTVLFDPKNLIITDSPPDALALARRVVSGSVPSAQPALIDGDFLGNAVALDGDRLAVGAPGDNTGGFQAGAVHLFTGVGADYSTLTWQKKLASGTGAFGMPALAGDDYFGTAVALDGDRLAVGAPFDDTGGTDRGAVHLFTGVGSDFAGLTWEKRLASGTGAARMPDLANSDDFGRGVALDGDRLAVGASVDDTGGPDRGAVHLFTAVGSDFSDLTWQKRLASGTGAIGMPVLANTDEFGYAVALQGDLLAVGALLDDTGGADRGAVHLFTGVDPDFTDLTWRGRLASATGASGMPALANGDYFGSGVALDGDRLAVGAQRDDTGGANRGAVHLLTGVGADFSGLTWRGRLASGTGAGGMPGLADEDAFGWSVALDGDRLAVGSRLDDTGGVNRGAVHLLTGVGADFSGLTWNRLLASGTGTVSMPALADGVEFGGAVALDGDRLAVGAYDDDTGGPGRGAVHLFTGVGADFAGLTWQKRLASGAGATAMPALADSDNFGSAIALDGDRLVVGAVGDDSGGPNRGAVHLLTGVGADFAALTWQGRLASSTGAAGMPALVDGDFFGSAVALDGDRLAVGASGDDTGGPGRGAVHLLTGVGSVFDALTWRGRLASGTSAVGMPVLADGDVFGTAVALDGDRLVVGAPFDDTGGADRGAAHLFTGVGADFAGLTWRGRLASGTGAVGMPVLADGDVFGTAVALDGDRLVVGAPFDDTGGANRGAAHLFTGVGSDFVGLTWVKRVASGTGAAGMPALADSDLFGSAVALDGDRLAVGAKWDDSGGPERGAVYLFTGLSTLGSGVIGVGDATFAANPGDTSYISPATITALTEDGVAVTLQANNDIQVLSDILAIGDGGGSLTLQAGRNIDFLASVQTPYGDLTAVAGDPGADPAHRDPGTPTLTIASGVTLNVQTGTAILAAIGGNVVNNAGDNAISTTGSGRWLIYAADPATSTEGFTSTSYNKHYNQAFTAGSTPAYAGSGNWILYSLAPTLTVAPVIETIAYGDAAPTAFTPSYSGFIDGDTADTAGLSGAAAWDIGGARSSSSNWTAGAHDVSFSGGLTSSLGYLLADDAASTGELTVTPRDLSAVYVALGRVYDGTTAVTLIEVPDGVLDGDSVFFSETAAFADKNVGTARPVSVTGITLTGTDAGNYALLNTTASTTADITARDLTVAYTGVDRVYDGTTLATVLGSSADLIAGDLVSFSETAAFADKNVGTARPVSVTGITLTGTDAGNYALLNTTASTTADITARGLTVAYTGVDRVYDATTLATVLGSSADLIAGDLVSFSETAAFADKNVGTAKPVSVTGISLSGTDAGNYALLSTTASTTADITARGVTVAYSGVDRVYDGTTLATVLGSSADLIAGDLVSFSETAAFADKNVGTAKPVSVSGITLAGVDAGNYALLSTTASTTADITARGVTVAYSGVDRVYDGTTLATVLGSSADLLAGDVVTFSETAAFADKNVGTAKPVSVTGISLFGTDAGNYALTSITASTTADISPRPLTVSLLGSVTRVYDGTTSVALAPANVGVAGLIPGDAIDLPLVFDADFNTASVGTGKPLTLSSFTVGGADASNYALSGLPVTASIGTVTPATLTYRAALVSGVAGRPIPNLTGAVTGFIGSDALATATSGALAWSTSATAFSPPGAYPVEGSGLSAINYVFAQAPANATALTLVGGARLEGAIEEAVQDSVNGLEVAVRLARAQTGGGGPVAGLGSVIDQTLGPAMTAAMSFAPLNLSLMTRADMQQILESREDFKRKLFADAIYKLEEDPSLADVPTCATLASADSGLCRMTDDQRQEAGRAMARQEEAGAFRVKLARLPQIQRKVAVLFGIDGYADPRIPSLDNPIADAEAVAAVLTRRLGYEVRVVKNASKADIVRTLNRLATEVGPHDSVIVYYAGHGDVIEKHGEGYWLPADASPDDPRQWLSNADLSRMLATIPASQVAMISDSCYSGAFTREQKVADRDSRVNPAEVLTRRSVVVMSSGGDEPVADSGRDGHSIFAWYLMEGLRGVTTWQPGLAVFRQVQHQVSSAFPQTPQYGAAASAGHQAGGEYLFEFRQLGGAGGAG